MKENMIYNEELPISEQNLIKRLLKKIVRIFILPFLRPYISFQNQMNEMLEISIQTELKRQNLLENKIDVIAESLRAELKKQAEREEEIYIVIQDIIKKTGDFSEKIGCTELRIEEKLNQNSAEIFDHLGQIARQVMFVKWQQIDQLFLKKEKESDVLTCKICGYSQERGKYKTKETDCIFHGGHLIRYICPQCGVIFGPTKFTEQGQKGIDDDYKVHYLGFSETDCSYKEERAFFMLNPDKESVYLNYGCGHWSNSLQNLREQGYKIYGYEPYSPDTENPYMITNKEKLSKMRFDGIYSNDLLEHLLDPVKDLKFMCRLLIDTNSKMAHSTACYVYKYEYTRFHTHFFTGDSVSVLSEKSGLKILDCCNDIAANDFICYVFSKAEEADELLKSMYVNENGEKDKNGTVLLRKNGILFGPYLTLPDRKYCLTIKVQGNIAGATIKVCSSFGKEVIALHKLKSEECVVEFELKKMQENIEFVIENTGEDMVVEKLYLS